MQRKRRKQRFFGVVTSITHSLCLEITAGLTTCPQKILRFLRFLCISGFDFDFAFARTHKEYDAHDTKRSNVYMPLLIDGPRPPRRHRFLIVLAILIAILFSLRTTFSYYIDALWFGSLGYGDVFRGKLGVQWTAFAVFAAATFLILYGTFFILKRAHAPELRDSQTILIRGEVVKLPVERFLGLLGLGVTAAIALATGASMMGEWSTLALYWHAPQAAGGVVDPIFGHSLNFFLFTLPAWQLIAGWLMTMAIGACIIAAVFIIILRALGGAAGSFMPISWRRFFFAVAVFSLSPPHRRYFL